MAGLNFNVDFDWLGKLPDAYEEAAGGAVRKRTLADLDPNDPTSLEKAGLALTRTGYGPNVEYGLKLIQQAREGKLATHKISTEQEAAEQTRRILDEIRKNPTGGGGGLVPGAPPSPVEVPEPAPAPPPAMPMQPPAAAPPPPFPPIAPANRIPELRPQGSVGSPVTVTPGGVPERPAAAASDVVREGFEGLRQPGVPSAVKPERRGDIPPQLGQPQVMSDVSEVPSTGATAQLRTPPAPAPTPAPPPPTPPVPGGGLPSYMYQPGGGPPGSIGPAPGAPPPASAPVPAAPPTAPVGRPESVYMPSVSQDINRLQQYLLALGPKAPAAALQALRQQFQHLLSREDWGPTVREYMFEQQQNLASGKGAIPFGEWQQRKELAKPEFTQMAEAYKDLRTKSRASDEMKITTDAMKTIMDNPNFRSGAGTALIAAGVNRIATFADTLDRLGVPVKDIMERFPAIRDKANSFQKSTELTQVFQSLQNRMVLNQLGSFGKAISDGDRNFTTDMVASVQHLPEANKLILGIYDQVAKFHKDSQRDAAEYLQRRGDKSLAGMDQYLDARREKRAVWTNPDGSLTEAGQRLKSQVDTLLKAPAQIPEGPSPGFMERTLRTILPPGLTPAPGTPAPAAPPPAAPVAPAAPPIIIPPDKRGKGVIYDPSGRPFRINPDGTIGDQL